MSRNERLAKAQPRTTTGSAPGNYRVGIVSDTHGLLRSDLVEAFAGVDLIIHAGDVGKETVLKGLRAIAPVVAVRGNMDRQRWAGDLRYTEVVEVGEAVLYVLHDLGDLGLSPEAAGIRGVISGHSHRPALSERDGVVYVNPGSAGPQRPNVPASAAVLDIHGERLVVQFVKLFK